MDHFNVFLSGAIPISPAIYGGIPAPVLFDNPNCYQQFDVVNGRFVLPERLIDCGFNSVLGTPPIPRGIGTQQQVVTRLVGVRCVGKNRHVHILLKVELLACVHNVCG